MKYFFLLLFLPLFSIGQNTDGTLSFEKVVNVDSSVSKEKLLMISEQWLTKTQLFVTKKLESRNRESGYLIVQTQYDFPLTTDHVLAKSIMKIDVKDGKVRIMLTDFVCRRYYEDASKASKTEDLNSRFNKRLVAKVNKISSESIDDFEKYVKENSAKVDF